MKSRLKLLIVFALQFVCVFAFAGCSKTTVIERVNKRYGVHTELLKDYEIVCDISGETFTGYAPHYALIQLNKKPIEFFDSYAERGNVYVFSDERNEKMEEALAMYSDMKIPHCYYPDWNERYVWNQRGGMDSLYTIYFSDEFKLIFFETGH